jgi:hypothetical protein
MEALPIAAFRFQAPFPAHRREASPYRRGRFLSGLHPIVSRKVSGRCLLSSSTARISLTAAAFRSARCLLSPRLRLRSQLTRWKSHGLVKRKVNALKEIAAVGGESHAPLWLSRRHWPATSIPPYFRPYPLDQLSQTSHMSQPVAAQRFPAESKCLTHVSQTSQHRKTPATR